MYSFFAFDYMTKKCYCNMLRKGFFNEDHYENIMCRCDSLFRTVDFPKTIITDWKLAFLKSDLILKSCIVLLRKNRSNQAKGRFLMAFSAGLKLGISDLDDVKIQDCFHILLNFIILDMEDRDSGDIFYENLFQFPK